MNVRDGGGGGSSNGSRRQCKHQRHARGANGGIGGSSGYREFPINIIHIILSYLPYAKERAQKALISTSWHFAWSTCPYLIFNQADITPRVYLYNPRPLFSFIQTNLDTYIHLVDGAISKYKQLSNNETVKQFRLQLKLFDSKLKDYMDRWIQIALYHRVEDFTLAIDDYVDEQYEDENYTMPKEVFSNRFIQTLTLLGGPRIRLPFISRADVNISLSGLRTLSLNVSMDTQTFKKLIAGCPLLEKLTIHLSKCIGRFDVSGLSRLKLVEVVTEDGFNLQADRGAHIFCIDAPKTLETLVLLGFGYIPSLFGKVSVDTYPRDLYLISWSAFVCQTCDENIRKVVTEDACRKSLMSDGGCLKVSRYLTPPQFQLITKNSTRKCGFDIKLHVQDVLCHHLFGRLKLFLNRCTSSAFKVLSTSVSFTGKVDRVFSCQDSSSPSGPACHIEQLNLDVKAIPSPCYSDLLSIVFGTLHPEKLYMSPNTEASFLESLCRKIEKKEVFSHCCLGRRTCWHQYLDRASIAIACPEGSEGFEPVCWTTLSDLLPSFIRSQQPVCFRLEWRRLANRISFSYAGHDGFMQPD